MEAEDRAPVVVNPSGPKPDVWTEPEAYSITEKLEVLNDITNQVLNRNNFFALPQVPEAAPVVVVIQPWSTFETPLEYDDVSPMRIVLENRSGFTVSGRLGAGNRLMFDRPLYRLDARREVIEIVDMIELQQGMSLFTSSGFGNSPFLYAEEKPADVEPASNPHQTMLNPKRKLRIGE